MFLLRFNLHLKRVMRSFQRRLLLAKEEGEEELEEKRGDRRRERGAERWKGEEECHRVVLCRRMAWREDGVAAAKER